MKKTIVIAVMLFNAISALSQSIPTVAQDFELFTMNVPSDIEYINSDDDSGCFGFKRNNTKFVSSICFFMIDERFDIRERMAEEASEFGIDINMCKHFSITTGKEAPLSCVMADIGEFTLIIGLYPDYKTKTGIYINIADGNKGRDGLAMLMLSSFRLKD